MKFILRLRSHPPICKYSKIKINTDFSIVLPLINEFQHKILLDFSYFDLIYIE